jgi:hypothetical protein
MTVIPNLDHAEYLSMPALSVSGMKQILEAPAIFKYWRDHKRPSKPAFDFGHLVHYLVLEEGPVFVSIPFDSYRTKAAQKMRDDAYAADLVPVLWADLGRAMACATAVLSDRVAASLLSHGRPEVTLTWTDPATGVPMRSRVDWLRDQAKGRLWCVDLKTAASAEPKTFARHAADFGYHCQQAMYEDGIKATGLSTNPGFLFVVVEVEPPHLVSVISLQADAVALGREQNAKAARIYKACVESGQWPNYTGGEVAEVGLPNWYVRNAEDELNNEEEAA